MIHKKGIENVNADALSISDHLDEPSKEENEEYQVDNEVAELKITYATNLGVGLAEIAKERQRFSGYLPAVHSMSQETRHKIILRGTS